MKRPHLVRRVQEYAHKKQLVLGERLGSGVHGIVFDAKNQVGGGRSALKVHEHEAAYLRERDVYLRLQELHLAKICGCQIPHLVAFDDRLMIIAMSIVTRPFVLDFGGAYLDRAPDFSEEVLADWEAEKQDQFGKRWQDVQAILGFLEQHDIYMIDVNPGNIAFED
jgi:hypothetical protein